MRAGRTQGSTRRLGHDEREHAADPDERLAPLVRLTLYGRAQPRRPVRQGQYQERKRPQRHRARVHAARGPALQ